MSAAASHPSPSAPRFTMAPVGLRGLAPANFGLVMATGIVSIASHLLGWDTFALALMGLNAAFYVILWALNIARLLRYPRNLLNDLRNHASAPTFFTVVAATGVLGSQCVVLLQRYDLAAALWVFTLALWVVATYGIIALLTITPDKPSLSHGINGTWLLAVVATQSLAVLGTQLGVHAAPALRTPWHFASLALWLWSGMLYIWIMALIFYRYTFFKLTADDLTPPYWINMGAMAISTLAGALLVQAAPGAPFLEPMLPFIKGFTLFYWASGTWWIPMLLVLGVWVFGFQREPLRYSAMFWGAVFPLGMYATCTFEMIRALDLPFLSWLPLLFGVVAVIAWIVTLAGLLHRVAVELRPRERH